MPQKHVLIVDDDPAILEVLSRFLASAEIRITTARRVSVARDCLMRQSVDLVIADARMPGESGMQLISAARDVGVPGILMSGEPEWTLEQGVRAEQYLAKPFDLRHLQRLVAAYLADDSDTALRAIC